MKNIWMMILATTIVGCTTTAPSIDTSADAEMSFDGLMPVKNGTFARAWVDPDIDITRYSKILPGEAKFEFRAVRPVPGTSSRSSSRNEFPISEQNQQKLIDTVNEIFNEELGKSKYFTLTDKPGPDVLIIEGAMLDIVSRVPPERAGRSDIFLSRVGEATLVLQLVDSESLETIYRAAERRAAETAGGRAINANTVTTWAEVKRLARRWATKLRSGLDSAIESSQTES